MSRVMQLVQGKYDKLPKFWTYIRTAPLGEMVARCERQAGGDCWWLVECPDAETGRRLVYLSDPLRWGETMPKADPTEGRVLAQSGKPVQPPDEHGTAGS